MFNFTILDYLTWAIGTFMIRHSYQTQNMKRLVIAISVGGVSLIPVNWVQALVLAGLCWAYKRSR